MGILWAHTGAIGCIVLNMYIRAGTVQLGLKSGGHNKEVAACYRRQ